MVRRTERMKLRANPLARRVTAAEFGDDWPLTVDAGWVVYDSTTEGVRFVGDDGRGWALNGAARPTWPSVEPIHRPNLNIPPIVDAAGAHRIRMSLAPLIAAAPGRRR